MLSDKVKVKRKTENELKSFKNKMGKHFIWFNSLSLKKQKDILYLWKSAKYSYSIDKSETKRIWNYKTKKFEIVQRRPPKLKHWILPLIKSPRFRVSKVNTRNTIIDLLIK